jgi:predicted Fe-Mo cluster-binding NifX family protein
MMTREELRTVMAVPSMGAGGLQARRSGHFGKCDSFTVVELGDGGIEDVRVVKNSPHHDGGCQGTVDLLESNGVTALLVGGMGGRALATFRSAGVEVYFDSELPLVGDAVDALLMRGLEPMQRDQACESCKE